VKRIARIAIGTVLFVGGAYLCVPRRSHWFEELRSQCQWQRGASVRLWEGNGGATTAFWYSVTLQSGLPWTEREVFFSYSHPVVTEVRCEADGVVVIADGTSRKLTAAYLLGGHFSPLQFDHGKQTSDFPRDGWRPSEIVRTALGFAGVVVGGWLLWRNKGIAQNAAQPAAAADRGSV
jgi:hypothetical protein